MRYMNQICGPYCKAASPEVANKIFYLFGYILTGFVFIWYQTCKSEQLNKKKGLPVCLCGPPIIPDLYKLL